MIVGFNFTKILGEKKKPLTGKVNVKNNVAIKSIEQSTLNFGKESQKCLRFTFEFTSSYDPEVGMVQLEGELIYLAAEAKIKEIVTAWQKNKKVADEDILKQVINTILSKANVEGLMIARDLGLPPAIQLPKVEIKKA